MRLSSQQSDLMQSNILEQIQMPLHTILHVTRPRKRANGLKITPTITLDPFTGVLYAIQ